MAAAQALHPWMRLREKHALEFHEQPTITPPLFV
jgi:hypothetical protein